MKKKNNCSHCIHAYCLHYSSEEFVDFTRTALCDVFSDSLPCSAQCSPVGLQGSQESQIYHVPPRTSCVKFCETTSECLFMSTTPQVDQETRLLACLSSPPTSQALVNSSHPHLHTSLSLSPPHPTHTLVHGTFIRRSQNSVLSYCLAALPPLRLRLSQVPRPSV